MTKKSKSMTIILIIIAVMLIIAFGYFVMNVKVLDQAVNRGVIIKVTIWEKIQLLWDKRIY